MTTNAAIDTVQTADAPGHLLVRRLGRREYLPTWEAMQCLTLARDPGTPDELWLVEHPPVFTLGRNGKREHVLDPGAIPVIDTDRGGQVTYHGPGQLVVYPLLDLARLGLGVRDLVDRLEEALIGVLALYGVDAERRPGAPGVYVAGRKIAAVGLRIRKGCSYHGLSFNVDMDLAPFARINPCGYRDLAVTQLRDEGGPGKIDEVAAALVKGLAAALGYATWEETDVGPASRPPVTGVRASQRKVQHARLR